MTAEVREDAPASPDARVLALDLGVYGHRGSITSMFWYQGGGGLHAHVAELLPAEATVLDQLDVLEALAESYPEYWRVSPVVVIGTTVLSSLGKRQVRSHLDGWYSPPWRRRLVSIGDYAGEQAATRGLVPRKKLRDLIAHRLTEHTLTLTPAQHDAVALYTGRRQKPGHDPDSDGWRHDDTDAMAVPVALACLAVSVLLPAAVPTGADALRHAERTKRAWQIELGLDEDEAWERAIRHGHPHSAPPRPVKIRRPLPGTPLLQLHRKGPADAAR